MRKITLIRVLYFTEGGRSLFESLREKSGNFIFCDMPPEMSRDDYVKESFLLHIPFMIIGSCGIAVRLIAPYVKDKLYDPPVIVMDEGGYFVIPLLSGHYGGGYDIARELSKSLSAKLISTSASDVNNTFAIDVFAKRNGFFISDNDHELIKKVNSAALSGEKPDLNYLSDGTIEVMGLKLYPKTLCLGMGSKKGKSFEELKAYLNRFFDDEKLRRELYAIGTVDLKAEEAGLLTLAAFYGAFFITYTKEELSAVTYDGLSKSDFVKETVGVDNVCERAALLLSGGEELLLSKKAGDGITIASAKRLVTIGEI